QVGGRVFTYDYPVTANAETIFEWDGMDAYGRVMAGRQPITVSIGLRYPMIARVQATSIGRSFGRFLSSTGPTSAGVMVVTQPGAGPAATGIEWRHWDGYIGNWTAVGHGLGGWGIDAVHAYDPYSQVLHRGDGLVRRAEAIGAVVETVAGGGSDATDGIPALEATVGFEPTIAVGAGGDLYIGTGPGRTVRVVDAAGLISTIIEQGTGGEGPGWPATIPGLQHVTDLAMAPDGSLYVLDYLASKVWRVDPDGSVTHVAGVGSQGYAGDNGPAVLATLYQPGGIAVGPGGDLFIADTWNNRVRHVAADGVITTVAGTGQGCGLTIFDPCPGVGGVPAPYENVKGPTAVAVAPDG
ncbi:MAG: hypothetical protein QF464_07210, partial [Myxococcota bacterium]|nr:hypothetical protein [Myxococcota bacterium]